MSSPARVGVLGCGVISRQYAENAKAFDSFELVSCADLDRSQAEALAEAHDLKVASVEELIGDPSIDIVLNLTPPARMWTVIRACLAAGKHVYTEKPLATETADAAELVAEARRLGLRIGCAPDTFLGSAYQAGRALLDAGAIGEPLSVSAAVLVGGQETWHPNPDIFFATEPARCSTWAVLHDRDRLAARPRGARRGLRSTRTRERTIQIGPRTGERFAVATPSHATAAMELDNGVTANLVASFETNGQYVCDLELHGTDGVICVPGPERLRRSASRAAAGGTAGRTSPSSRAEIAMRAASACTSSSRRSRPAGRSARREASACTSSTSLAASSSPQRRTGSWRSTRASLSPRRCRSRRSPDVPALAFGR